MEGTNAPIPRYSADRSLWFSNIPASLHKLIFILHFPAELLTLPNHGYVLIQSVPRVQEKFHGCRDDLGVVPPVLMILTMSRQLQEMCFPVRMALGNFENALCHADWINNPKAPMTWMR